MLYFHHLSRWSNPAISSRDITDPKYAPYATRRVPQIYDKPEFYVQGADYSDVVQGGLVLGRMSSG